MKGAPLVVVGDALLDRDVSGSAERLCPDAPVPVLSQEEAVSRPGGAALAAALAAREGMPVVLVTALAPDAAGRELAGLIEASGVTLVDAGMDQTTPEKIRLRSGNRSLLRLDRGGGGRPGPLPEAARAAIAAAAGVLVSDYGRGLAAAPDVRGCVAGTWAPVVWDPHPRGADPTPGARLVTPNRSEILDAALAGPASAGRAGTAPAGAGLAAITAAAEGARTRWHAHGVAVTLGSQGALLVGEDGPPLAVPADAAEGGDPCGAGDCFAATAAAALAGGRLPSEAVVAAVSAAARFVAGGGSAALRVAGSGPAGDSVPLPSGKAPGALGAALEVAGRVRAGGGTVVAAGGCFDLLHAGHVHMLRAARALGDCLIVCVNSDSSVRRIKGPARPVVPEADRVAMLAALSCVDAVVVFDEDTPVPVLRRLRPHVFAKGGDYAGRRVPEAELLEGWGGQAVVLPYLDGRSTTRVLRDAAQRT